MNKQQKARIEPDKIRIVAISLVRGSLDTKEAFLAHPIRPSKIDLKVNHLINFYLEDNRSIIRLNFIVEGKTEDESPLGIAAAYTIDFLFEVENMPDFVDTGNSTEIKVDGIFGATLLGLALSTSRGILLERTHGTYFANFLLPVLDPMRMIGLSDQGEHIVLNTMEN